MSQIIAKAITVKKIEKDLKLKESRQMHIIKNRDQRIRKERKPMKLKAYSLTDSIILTYLQSD